MHYVVYTTRQVVKSVQTIPVGLKRSGLKFSFSENYNIMHFAVKEFKKKKNANNR